MTTSIGMAIQITEKNRHCIAIVNCGVVPELEEKKTYFYFPYDYDSSIEMLDEETFHKTYRFANTEDLNSFVDVDTV